MNESWGGCGEHSEKLIFDGMHLQARGRGQARGGNTIKGVGSTIILLAKFIPNATGNLAVKKEEAVASQRERT